MHLCGGRAHDHHRADGGRPHAKRYGQRHNADVALLAGKRVLAVIVHEGNCRKKKQHARAYAKGVKREAEKRKQVRPKQEQRYADKKDGRRGFGGHPGFLFFVKALGAADKGAQHGRGRHERINFDARAHNFSKKFHANSTSCAGSLTLEQLPPCTNCCKNPRHEMLARQCVLSVAPIVALQDVTHEDSMKALLAGKHFKMKTHQGTRAAKGPNL